MNAVRQFLARVKKTGVRRPSAVTTIAMGRTHVFRAWDVGNDTFIFEEGVAAHLSERLSVLVVEKRALRRKVPGRILTMTTGNHSVAAFPLLDGRFWKFSGIPAAKRGEVLMGEILCANVTGGGRIETSQRDVPLKLLVAADEWLQAVAGFSMGDIVMSDRNEQALDYYRRLGQEWRIKPLVWTEAEMKVALAASVKRIATKLRYYHSSRGVHFLSFAEFRRFTALAETSPEDFIAALRELVSVYEGHRSSFTRLAKYRGHHEIEFFGLRRGVGVERLVPELEKLMEAVALGRTGQLGIIQKADEIATLYASLLTRPEFVDETSGPFVESLYMHITGEIYSVAGEGTTPAFDDRRLALPGATFVEGRPVFHAGADDRTRVLLVNLRRLMSKDEQIVYANVYELREEAGAGVGCGKTREVVYLTNLQPLEKSLVEKRLSTSRVGYGSYMFARIGAFQSLGISLSPYYRLLRRQATRKGARPFDYYIRFRCEGEPLDAVPASYFANSDDASIEERDVVLGLATLMGDAAAQNLAMKKYDPVTKSPLFGVGKEIYDFEYDIIRQRVVPKKVATCSVRGSLGWPELAQTDENLAAIADFYLHSYARALLDFQRRHETPLEEVVERFLDGFEYRTHALAWQLSVCRDQFEDFRPKVPAYYGFNRKWRFVLWSLERQERRLKLLKQRFKEIIHALEEVRQ